MSCESLSGSIGKANFVQKNIAPSHAPTCMNHFFQRSTLFSWLGREALLNRGEEYQNYMKNKDYIIPLLNRGWRLTFSVCVCVLDSFSDDTS